MPAKEVEVKFKATSDDAALQQFLSQMKEATVQLSEAGKASKETTGAFSVLKDGLREVGEAIAGLFALQKITAFLMEGARAAADKERTLKQLSNTVAQFGGNADTAAEKAEALANALQKKGFADDEILAGVRSVTTQTHDYEQALWAASLAADISAKTGKSYGESLDILQGLMAGKDRSVVQAHKDFGTVATTCQGTIDELDRQFKGYAGTLDDTKAKLAAAKEELNDLGEQLGGPVNSTLLFIIKAFKSLGIAISGVGLAAYQAADLTVTSFRASLNAIASIDWKHPVESYKKASFDMLADTKAKIAEMKAAWSQWADDSADILGGGGAIPGGGKKGVATPEKPGGKGLDDLLAEFYSEQMTELNKMLAEEGERIDKYLEERLRKHRETEKSIVQTTKESLDKQAKDQIAYGKRVEAIEKHLAKDIRRMDLWELSQHRSDLKKLLEAEKDNAEYRADIQEKLNMTQREMALATAQTVVGSFQMVVDQSTTLGRSLNAMQQMLSFMAALRYAFEMAAGAGAETPGDVYTRIAAYAAALATGLGAVSAIQNVAGKGFDDPRNDIAAYAQGQVGGWRWADDMLNKHSQGMAAGWVGRLAAAGLFGPSPSAHQSSVHNVNHSSKYAPTIYYSPTNLFGAEKDNGLRKVAKMLIPAQRYNDRNVIRPKPRFSKATGRGL